MYYSTRHEEVLFKMKYINISAMKPVFKMLSWISVASFSSVFIYKIDALFINVFFGLYYTGVLGSISEFGSYCICITGVIGLLFRPLMLIAYSEKRHDELIRITINGAYIVGIISSLLCGVVMGLSSSLLRVWLNDEISQYSIWMMIKMLIIPITTYGSTIGIVNNLWNNVKSFAVWSIVIALAYVLVSLVVLNLGLGMIAFLIVGALSAILQGAILHISIYNKAYPKSTKTVYAQMMKCCVYFILICMLSLFVNYMIDAKNLPLLIVEIIISVSLGMIISLPFLNRQNLDMLDVVLPIRSVVSKLYKK